MAHYEPRDKFYLRPAHKGCPREPPSSEEILIGFRLVRAGARGGYPTAWMRPRWLAGHPGTAVGPEGRVVGVDLSARRSARIEYRDDRPRIRVQSAKRPCQRTRRPCRPVDQRSLAKTHRYRRTRPGALFRTARGGAEFASGCSSPALRWWQSSSWAAASARCDRVSRLVSRASRVVRTQASRPGSAELYIVARSFRGLGPPQR